MAQTTRSGTSDVPTGLHTNPIAGTGYRGRTGSLPKLLGYEIGYSDGAADQRPVAFGAGVNLGQMRGYSDGLDDGRAEAGLAYLAGVAQAAGIPPILTPVLSSITPAPLPAQPGDAGAFSVDFRVARLTPIEFDVTQVASGANIAIIVLFGDRNESYTALDADGVWRWPWDVAADNVIGVTTLEPVHVRMLPRGGWPPTIVRFQVANARASV